MLTPAHTHAHYLTFNNSYFPYSFMCWLTDWLADLPTDRLTDMEQSPWKANRLSASQEVPYFIQTLKVQYCVHESPPLVPNLSQMYPFCTFPHYLCKIHSNIIIPFIPRSSKWSSIPIVILYAFFIFPIHATWSALLILDLITIIISCQEYKLLIHYVVFPVLLPLPPS